MGQVILHGRLYRPMGLKGVRHRHEVVGHDILTTDERCTTFQFEFSFQPVNRHYFHNPTYINKAEDENMIDIQFIRENPELVAQKSKEKGYPVDLPRLLELDVRRRDIQTEAEQIRAQRNDLAAATKGTRPAPEQVEQGKMLKAKISDLEQQLEPVDAEYQQLLRAVPNMPLADVPVGATEDENVVIKQAGERPVFDFNPKHDHELGELHDLIDKERAAKIAGSRFVYLKGDLVRLQFAIIQFVMQTLTDEQIIRKLIEANGLNVSAKPFTPILPPAMLRTEPYAASARLNAEEVTYKIEQDDLWLNASAEHTLCTMYWNEVLPEAKLPIRYIGYSTSFRREAGTYGKDVEGIFRLHQFDKLEMEVFSTAETGLDEHKLLIAIQEYLVQQLGLPYQLLLKCTADIGKPNARGVDINCWFPGQGKYRETHTADYMTDYQARDLKIRVRHANNRIALVHTNDATAFALGRTLKALIENYQTKDGRIIVPEVLRPYMGGQAEI
ncbi:MAG TPA: serine--tRNA ligase [Candidatus Saccharimonadales bacterium]|nr:serine--tRNA ligase [Candidatus Saccharimonadales bacterium]